MIFGLWAAVVVAVNFGFSYYFYTLGKEAAAANDWPTALYYLFLSVYSAAMAFTTVSVAIDNQRAAEENAKSNSGSGANSTGNTQTATVIKKYGPCNPGPLKPSVANSFNGGTYTEEVLNVDTTYYRVYGGQSGKAGSYMTSAPQNGGMQSQMDLALNPEWGNTAQYVTKVTVPA